MNNRPHPPPTVRQAITINDIIQIRLALEQIKDPSPRIKSAIANLDAHIEIFTSSLHSGEPSNG